MGGSIYRPYFCFCGGYSPDGVCCGGCEGMWTPREAWRWGMGICRVCCRGGGGDYGGRRSESGGRRGDGNCISLCPSMMRTRTVIVIAIVTD